MKTNRQDLPKTENGQTIDLTRQVKLIRTELDQSDFE